MIFSVFFKVIIMIFYATYSSPSFGLRSLCLNSCIFVRYRLLKHPKMLKIGWDMSVQSWGLNRRQIHFGTNYSKLSVITQVSKFSSKILIYGRIFMFDYSKESPWNTLLIYRGKPEEKLRILSHYDTFSKFPTFSGFQEFPVHLRKKNKIFKNMRLYWMPFLFYETGRFRLP